MALRSVIVSACVHLFFLLVAGEEDGLDGDGEEALRFFGVTCW